MKLRLINVKKAGITSVFIPVVNNGWFALTVAVILVLIFFVIRTKKLKGKIEALQAKKNELSEQLTNAEQLNKNLANESILEKDKVNFLMSKMSFEIHNCVNGIIGITTLLKDTPLTIEQQKNTDIIINCSRKLLDAADDSFNPGSTMNNAIITSVNNSKPETVETFSKDEISADFFKKFPYSILVAEDDMINQKLASKLLEKLGYHADIASNGKEALEMVSEKNYDIILMDVLMPEMDGFEATKMIRLCLDTQPVIIALTASAMAGDKEKCIKAGMNDYLCKPINLNEMARLFVKWNEQKKLVL